MTKIEMQEENCDTIHGRMDVGGKTLSENLTNLSMAVSDSIGTTWCGPSAEEFLREFSGLQQQLQGEINLLQQLTARFGTAIQNFKEVDAKLG